MTESAARHVARLLGGTATESRPAGAAWVVVFARDDGAVVILDEHGVGEYFDRGRYEDGREDYHIDFH